MTFSSTGKKYEIARVCRVLDILLSTFYMRKNCRNELSRELEKRGPKTEQTDEELLELIRRTLRILCLRVRGTVKYGYSYVFWVVLELV